MQVKYILLALMMASFYNDVSTHILTSSHIDGNYLYCMRLLSQSVRYLCPNKIGSSETYEFEYDKWESDPDVVKKCCLKACTISELLQFCY